MSQGYITKSFRETKKLGEKLAKDFLKKGLKNQALVIGLKGDLGGGKTTFMQGFSKGLEIKEKILSPTFVILKRFPIINHKSTGREADWPEGCIINHKSFHWLYHIDCYRIKKEKELLDLGFKNIISEPQNIIVVEWADKIKKIMPPKTIWINFEFIDENKREIRIQTPEFKHPQNSNTRSLNSNNQ